MGSDMEADEDAGSVAADVDANVGAGANLGSNSEADVMKVDNSVTIVVLAMLHITPDRQNVLGTLISTQMAEETPTSKDMSSVQPPLCQHIESVEHSCLLNNSSSGNSHQHDTETLTPCSWITSEWTSTGFDGIVA